MLATTETSGPAPSSRRRVVAIARNTFREAVRDRVLYNLVLFVLLLSVSAVFLGAASASQDAKIIVYLGLSAMLPVNVVVMGAGVTLVLLYVVRGTTPLLTALWPAVALIYLELTLLTAVALLFSSFSSPIFSAFASLAVFVIGPFTADLKSFATLFDAAAAKGLLIALYYGLPNLST